MDFKQDVDDGRAGIGLNFRVKVTIVPGSGTEVFNGWSVDVSASGVNVNTEMPALYNDSPCFLSTHFPGTHSNLVIEDLKGRTARIEDNSVGISFDQPFEWFLLFPVYQRKIGSVDV